MKSIQIPKTKLQASVLCLGTSMYGSAISEEESFRMLDVFFEAGGNFLDTANIYADWIPGAIGASEKTIGKWLISRGVRDQMIVGTKGGHPLSTLPHSSRLNRKDLLADIEESLRRLSVESIDLFYLHRDEVDVPVEEIIEILNEFIKSGKVNAIATSNWHSKRIMDVHRYAEAKGLASFCVSQIGWSLAKIKNPNRVYMDEETLKFHKETKIPVVAYSSRATGFFAGKFGGRKLIDAIPGEKWTKDFYYSAENARIFRRTEILAKKLNVPNNSVALAYISSQDFPGFAIIGGRNAEQVKQSCSTPDLTLTQEEIKYLEGGKSLFFWFSNMLRFG